MAKGNRRGMVRDFPRFRAATQKRMLEAREFDPIYTLNKDISFEDAVKSLRAGNVCGVARLWILADPKKRRKGGMRQALYDAVDAIEERGAIIEEVDSGRVSTNKSQRDAMIREAAEVVTRGGQAAKSAKNLPKGRKAVEFAPEVYEKAKSAWESRKYKTWDDVAKALPPGFTVYRAHKLWGKRNTD